MIRKYFKLPPNEFFERFSDDAYRYERARIIRRTKFVYRRFGPPRDMIFVGVMTADTYYEMLNSFIYGNFLSTIFSTNAFIESVLGFKFIMSFGSDDKIVDSGLAKMTRIARYRGWLSPELCDRLDELRRMRIAYFHAHIGLDQRGAMKRYLDKRNFGYKQQQHDAKQALTIVYEFLKEDSPNFFSTPSPIPRSSRKRKAKSS